jgi:hypothetical protein
MKSEAALIMGAIMAVLTLANITLMPEDMQAIQVLVETFILGGGVTMIRQFVYSRKTFRKFLKSEGHID